MSRKIRKLALSCLVAGGITAPLLVPAAASATPVPGATAVAPSAPGATKPPRVAIETLRRAAVFYPDALSVGRLTGRCSKRNYSFKIANTTEKTQQLTRLGSRYGPPIPRHKYLPVCAETRGTFVLGLESNRHAKLTIKVK